MVYQTALSKIATKHKFARLAKFFAVLHLLSKIEENNNEETLPVKRMIVILNVINEIGMMYPELGLEDKDLEECLAAITKFVETEAREVGLVT